MRTGIYPGTFDPVTFGHLDVIRRASKLVDKLIVGVTTNQSKKPLFSLQERVTLLKESIEEEGLNADVKSFDCLTVKFAQKEKASVIFRGLRALSEFEDEFQNASMNRKLAPGIETVFIVTDEKFFYLNSGIVRELAGFGQDLKNFVPKKVEEKLREKLFSKQK